MIEEFVATDTAAMQGKQVSVECSDDGDNVHTVLDGIRIARRFSLNFNCPIHLVVIVTPEGESW